MGYQFITGPNCAFPFLRFLVGLQASPGVASRAIRFRMMYIYSNHHQPEVLAEVRLSTPTKSEAGLRFNVDLLFWVLFFFPSLSHHDPTYRSSIQQSTTEQTPIFRLFRRIAGSPLHSA